MKSPRRFTQEGFSLAELLVACATVGLVATGLVTFLAAANTSYLTGANQVEAQAAARTALERMAQEIRGAGYNPQALPNLDPIVGPSPGFTTAPPTATVFTIQNDLNGDGDNGDVVGGQGERITYTLTGTTLERQEWGVDANPQVVIGGVQALQFSYWRQDGTEINPVTLAEVPNIRSVQITLTTQPEFQPASWQTGAVSVTMTNRVRLRNR